ncbi:MAG: hypothetical protein HY698_03180 [Deltaproteobacteria bacterium]|nr:hypothetical protein [Deltaproteobacteria bacterium]
MRLPLSPMTRRFPSASPAFLQVVLGLVLALAATACQENPVGRSCFIGSIDAGSGETILSSPALECQSRLCLHVPSTDPEAKDMCTAECSDDSDCDKVAESPCKKGFACTVPVVTGAFCCKKLCVCRDSLTIPDGGIQVPAVCDPENKQNSCCNLQGRRGNTDYPLCASKS